MTKAEFVKKLKDQAGIVTASQAEKVYDQFVDILLEKLQQGEDVTIMGIGKFKVVNRAARKGRNPRTGKEIAINACKAVKFLPAKALKDSLN